MLPWMLIVLPLAMGFCNFSSTKTYKTIPHLVSSFCTSQSLKTLIVLPICLPILAFIQSKVRLWNLIQKFSVVNTIFWWRDAAIKRFPGQEICIE